jgi:teichuronic acid biosynthesis glycosyltransferase TuaG
MELVSIITPTYNSANFVLATINSVKKQTYTNWEMLIVDDCSTDTTFDIVRKQAELDKRIKVFKLNKNSGAGSARQYALELAQGRFIAFLDSDDLWKPNKLSEQIEFLLKNDIAVTFSSYELMDEEGKLLNILVKVPKSITYKELFYCNWIGNLTGVYDTVKLGKISISNYRKRQDWIMWLQILKSEKRATSIQKNLATYRVRSNSISASKIGLLKSNYLVYRSYHKQNIVKSCFSMIIFLYNQLIIKKRYIVKL